MVFRRTKFKKEYFPVGKVAPLWREKSPQTGSPRSGLREAMNEVNPSLDLHEMASAEQSSKSTPRWKASPTEVVPEGNSSPEGAVGDVIDNTLSTLCGSIAVRAGRALVEGGLGGGAVTAGRPPNHLFLSFFLFFLIFMYVLSQF